MNFKAPAARSREVLLAALIWPLVTAGLAGLHLALAEEPLTPRAVALIGLFAVGGLAGAIVGWPLALWLSDWRRVPSARFAALFLCLGLATVGATSLLYFLQFRAYYAQWHQPMLSVGWVIETLVTGLNAAYLFAIDGLRILLPAGLPLLVGAAVVFVRRRQREDQEGCRPDGLRGGLRG
ncbi:hypothetical protein [Pannonibacter tanglangensis]|uniref:Uncharacterized protein n=1 Tax=Pannonibacter tanglangensis TaxID=2750084 RepID=A0ABW9ZJ09_9HYPH|nr:hypothetical protein [Pannonibacter sp. XCT-34]NBN63591.1 hypothetical protein [Pannonibacter sp. XCT-34]